MFPAMDDRSLLAQSRQSSAVVMLMQLAGEATADVNDYYSETWQSIDRRDARLSAGLMVNEEMRYDCC